MFRRVPIAIVLTLAGCAVAAAAERAEATFTAAPPADWVESVTPGPDGAVPADGTTGGRYVLLDDTQIRVNPRGRDLYGRVVTRALTAAGVEDLGQINLRVDPTFQGLVLHHVRIIRNGHPIEQLGHARITTVPVEAELDRRIYNGTHTVNILLEDLRIGDVVDYAYTRRSRDPVWPEHFFFATSFGSSAAVRLKRLRIVYPLDRLLRFKAHGGQVAPREDVDGRAREMRFEWRDVAATAEDSSRPSWDTPWPWLEVSDWTDWGEVARSAAALYTPLSGGPGRNERLAGVIASIQDGSGTADQKAQGALQFVQEQIRYTSVSVGAGAWKPSSPETVLERRFGDCKDKSLLLVSLLNRLGIEAVPVLVNSSRGHLLPDRLPSMAAFDHVITRLSLPAGVFWVDPTAQKQLLPISRLDAPDFEHGLPLTASTDRLEAIPRPATAVLRREVDVNIDVSRGLAAAATLDIVTRIHGAEADSNRARLAATSAAARQKNYLNYYAQYFPGIQSVAPPTIEENASHDLIAITEHYRLPSAFSKDEDGVLRLQITPDEITPYSEPVDGTLRSSPLGLAFPVSVVQSFRVNLPDDGWSVKSEKVSVENPAFRYSSDVRLDKRQLKLRYSYVALGDHVALEELTSYLADRARMHKDLGFRLTWNPPAASHSSDFSVAPLPFFVLLIAFAGGGWLAVRIYRLDPPPRLMRPGDSAPQGIRGWLLLPALYVLALPCVLIWLQGVSALYVQSDVWAGIAKLAVPEAKTWLRWALIACFAGTAALLPVTIALGLLFFRKRTSTPVVFVAAMFATLVVATLFEGVLTYSGLDDSTSRSEFWAQTARETLVTVFWCVYMMRSRRVRATFAKRVSPATGRGSATFDPRLAAPTRGRTG